MTKKTCKGCAIACLLISLLGLVSFLGGIKPVNIGAFVFPLLLAASAFIFIKRKRRNKPGIAKKQPLRLNDGAALLLVYRFTRRFLRVGWGLSTGDLPFNSNS